MPRELSGIYGADDNDFAEGIAADALDPAYVLDDPYMWGNIHDMRAQAQANVGKESLGPTDPKSPVTKRINESPKLDYPQTSAMPRHVKGPTTATSTGGKDSLVPGNQKDAKTGKQRGPAFANETS
jgi:hypothetical protein